jgi:uncharacterized membrane protein YozB (DUF420 family)
MFLTGPRDPLLKFLRETFYEPVQPGSEIGHSPRLMAVDADGHIHGYVDGTDRAELPRLRQKLRWLVLAKYQYFPTVNAALNGLSGLLLLAGFIAIRTRRVAAHKALMLAALAVSAAFLGCYLYYHYVVLGGRPSGFPGEGWVRPVYFAVLVSHTLLAAVVAPLAVVTAYQGLRDRLARHVRLARWTLPLWLYVSATGVLVYYLRYHLYP